MLDVKFYLSKEVQACAEQHEQAGSAVSALVLREVALWLEGKGKLPAPPKLSAYVVKRDSARAVDEDATVRSAASGLAQVIIDASAGRYGSESEAFDLIVQALGDFAKSVRRGA